MGWAGTEFETIDLGDERRNKRAAGLRGLGRHDGGVHFFDNDEVDWCAILEAHTDCAKTRMAAHKARAALCRPAATWPRKCSLPQATSGSSGAAGQSAGEQPEAGPRMIDWYRTRREIEMFFHVLKNGCRIEALQLGSIEKIERALVLYMMVAWRIAHLRRLGRARPE